MSTTPTAHDTLDAAEREVQLLRAALTQADAALVAATEHAIPGADLVALRADREGARKALEESENKLPKLRAEVANEDQRKATAEAAERQRAAAEEARAEEARRAAEHVDRLEAPLAALAVAEEKARMASHTSATIRASVPHVERAILVKAVLEHRPREARALDGALIKAVVAGEQLVNAAADVEKIDPRRPEARRARAIVKAGEIHGMEADLGEAVFLFAAARTLLAAALEAVTKIAAANPGKPVADLAHGLVKLDSARGGEPLSLMVPLGAWLGAGATEDEGLALVASACKVLVPSGVSAADVGRAALSGEAHKIGKLADERAQVARLAGLRAATDGAPVLVAAVRAAAVEYRDGRPDDERAGELRALVEQGIAFVVEQVQGQVTGRRPRGPFKVALSPGLPANSEIDNLTRPIAGRPGHFTGAASLRDQVIAFLGLASVPELVALVPEVIHPADMEDAAA